MIRQKWVNIEDEGAIHALLPRISTHVPVDTIDTLWLLATRRSTGVESTVVIISAFDPDDPERRRVGAVRWLVTRDRKGAATVTEQIDEYARAPVDALERVVEGVMRRLGDDAETPRTEVIAGDAERWTALLLALGASPESMAADPPGSITAPDEPAPDPSVAVDPPTVSTADPA